MVLCSIVIVMAIATPTSLKVPGLGTDLSIAVPVAFGLLGITLIYMFATYFVEMRTLLHRHSKAILDEGKGTLDEKIAQKQEKLAGDFSQAQYQVHNLRSALSETEQAVKEVVGPQLLNKGRLLGDKPHDINMSIGLLESLVKNAQAKMELLDGRWDHYAKEIDALKATCENLDRNFSRLSSDISRTQRAGFRVLEQTIPMLFAAVAFLVSVDGALNHSRVASVLVAGLAKPGPSADHQ
ncbi:hypothetical protein [Sphingobium sp. B12D2B]|uniref:hypothetical protein n=1 Tax=Sphingobium sp. B12D2B TaxID=2940577 RepID=UPI0022253647|nr:hypothetical protein [Sphingobium sp. B12D2B]